MESPLDVGAHQSEELPENGGSSPDGRVLFPLQRVGGRPCEEELQEDGRPDEDSQAHLILIFLVAHFAMLLYQRILKILNNVYFGNVVES